MARGVLPRLGWGAYQAAVAAGLALAGPVLLVRRGGHHLPTVRGRLGRYPEAPAAAGGPAGGGLWLHAVSVGEVAVAATLARALPAGAPALVTTVTPTGQERARAAFGGRSQVAYLPFDLGPAVRRFYRRFAPGALVLVEGDYWPLLLREAARRGLPVAVVNGRVGDRSFRRMRRLRRLLGPLFDPVAAFGVQTADDARRLSELGVAEERIVVTGNLKYESPEPPPVPELEAGLRRLAGGRPLVVAGSTMAGEEERVLAAFREAGGGERALLVLAPRHPERFEEAAGRVAAAGFRLVRRSRLQPEGDHQVGGTSIVHSRGHHQEGGTSSVPSGGHHQEGGTSAGTSARPDVLLLDTLGELASLDRLAATAFIGGTLVPTGGHNPLEAARWGVPVAVGPSMENFREMAADFDRRGAWARVADAAELGRVWRRWLDGPEEAARVGARGRALVEENRGALARTLDVLRPILARVDS
ncbi:MAG TPA: 3-deoxy-D-manno-octulosonic acid transferase [Thermoanaerobaculia bacterium]|nr:3-deoxy-D-manno-octulosonic acid transferase [Thermoanaerobaculia bacterium]